MNDLINTQSYGQLLSWIYFHLCLAKKLVLLDDKKLHIGFMQGKRITSFESCFTIDISKNCVKARWRVSKYSFQFCLLMFIKLLCFLRA